MKTFNFTVLFAVVVLATPATGSGDISSIGTIRGLVNAHGMSASNKRKLGDVTFATFDFESGDQGWTAAADSNSECGATVTATNHWSLAYSLPGSSGVNLGGSTWWTNPNNGNSGPDRSHVTSPPITARCTNPSISFDSYSSNESGYPTNWDVEHVQLSINGGSYTDIHGHTDELHDSCDQTFRTITFTVNSGIAIGDDLLYRFLYDTCDGCCGCSAITGWAFDNVQITCPDDDGDGVINAEDLCPETEPDVAVDDDGCSGEQLVDIACVCDSAEWKNHGEYVSCVSHAAQDARDNGLLDLGEISALISERAETPCGKVDICHVVGSGKNCAAEYHTLFLPTQGKAITKHLQHGDVIDSCADNCDDLCDSLEDEEVPGCMIKLFQGIVTPATEETSETCCCDSTPVTMCVGNSECATATGDECVCTVSGAYPDCCEPQTQDIMDSDLFNQASNCGNGNYYNGCNGHFGFYFTPPSNCGTITIDFNIGVSCGGATSLPVYLNGNHLETLTGTGLQDCTCNPDPDGFSVTATANDLVGGVNIFRIATTTCTGFSPVSGSVYATITYSV
jgi:hypothetical protein